VKHFSWRAELDVDFETAAFFYTHYFKLFDRTGKEAEGMIRETLGAFSRDGRIRASGESKAVVLWWPAAQL
jgi:hypothetical protein